MTNEFENVELYDEFYECRPAYLDVNDIDTSSLESIISSSNDSNDLNNNDIDDDNYQQILMNTKESLKTYVIISLLENCRLYLPKQYDEIVYLSSGQQGVLCAARDRLTGKMVAIKKFDHPFEHIDNVERLLREFRILKFVNHPNVMMLLDAFPGRAQSLIEFEDVYLVTELMDYDLSIICNDRKHFLNHSEIAEIIYQILCGIQYLHRIGLVHGDLSPANIVIRNNRFDDHLEVKIIDFGQTKLSYRSSSSSINNSNKHQSSLLSTRSYRAPEVLLNMDNHFDFPIDIWSIGCIMFELLSKDVLIQGISDYHQWKHIESILGNPKDTFLRRIRSSIRNILGRQQRSTNQRNRIDQIFNIKCESNDENEYFNEQAKDLLQRILVVDPRERITVDDALKHPYFKARTNSKLPQQDDDDNNDDDDEQKMDNNQNNFEQIIEYREPFNDSIDTIDTLSDDEQYQYWKKLLFDEIRLFQHKHRQQIRQTLNSII
uniref:Stress-activated protein kinase JNK n=1 Tax=Dermatophagoides pteronyssinus TaxID=6956 RepID=A0A6P6YBL3_DERPT|nr:stress-activated protein kinase JNK-like [Dermatophagoides pteronyssinus]